MSQEALNVQANNMLLYSQLYQMQNYINRIINNLALVNQYPNAQIVTVIGGNLFQLASQYYNDASQWSLIAQVNNITDPMIVGEKTLLIPPLNGQDTGGIWQ